MKPYRNVINTSGGKDSTAVACLAREREIENAIYVFADTGNEHSITLEHLDYLEDKLNINILRIKADFSERIVNRRKSLLSDDPPWWVKKWDDSRRLQAAELLIPTGIPFLDLCMLKGRFPSRKAQFCTEELKIAPIRDQIVVPLLSKSFMVINWLGIRKDESAKRAKDLEMEKDFGPVESWEGIYVYRPILDWTANDCFDIARRHGLRPNPLYQQGMGRIGCMPCINCRKHELRELANRFPEHIDRIKEWERIISQTSKRGSGTFFPALVENADYRKHGIYSKVEWSRTSYGGRQLEMGADQYEQGTCASIYNVCE